MWSRCVWWNVPKVRTFLDLDCVCFSTNSAESRVSSGRRAGATAASIRWQSYLDLISDIFRYVFDRSCSELSNAAFSVPLWSLVQEIIFGENGCLTLCPMAIVNFARCPFCSTGSGIFWFVDRKSAWAKHGQAVVAGTNEKSAEFPIHIFSSMSLPLKSRFRLPFSRLL